MHKAHIGVDAEPPLLDVVERVSAEQTEHNVTTTETLTHPTKDDNVQHQQHPVGGKCGNGCAFILPFYLIIIPVMLLQGH